jgi:prepilin-type N-terminal cleavage/methylation domain-containing protein
MKYLYNRGFTLIEILLVIAILVILVSVTLPKFAEMRAHQVLRAAVEDITSVLNKARSQTLASLESSEYGVHFEADSVTIFKGDTYSVSDPDNQVIDIVSPASISSISLTGGTSNIYFARLTGAPSATGSVTVENGITTKTISVSAAGAVGSN